MEITSTRHSMFDLPVWDFDLSEPLNDIREELAAEALDAARRMPAANRPFRQSTGTLGEMSELWGDVVTVFRDIVTTVIEQAYRSLDGVAFPEVQAVRCWSLLVDSAEQWDSEAAQFRIVHNHPGATFLECAVSGRPGRQQLRDRGDDVREPALSRCGSAADPAVDRDPWRLLHLLVFPSWLEHGPTRPTPSAGTRLPLPPTT